jgi:hypothetical protein
MNADLNSMRIPFTLALLVTLGFPIHHRTLGRPGDRIPAEQAPWRGTNHILEGWDWSLPPGLEPVPFSGTSMPWPDVDGKRWDLPGNELEKVVTSWRALEPIEGTYAFDGLRQEILQKARHCDGVILHVRGSVWAIRDFPDHPNAQYPAGWLEKQKPSNESAPRWLARYGITKLPGRPRFNIGTPFQIINLDVFDEEYHRRYLKFVEALGESGIPQMPEVMASYLHFASGSRGEEGEGLNIPERPGDAEKMRQRTRAWARAFNGVEYKLAAVSGKGPALDYAYSLGLGQRNGFVDMVLQGIDNPQIGQVIDSQGYLTVDESIPPIRDGRAFGDENEEFTRNGIPRFGPWETFAHRYRESMLRVLTMRRNLLWIEPTRMNPPLTAYVSLELGRTIEDTPDIWCYLRQSVAHSKGQPKVVKNFERWLYQRDRDGYAARATKRVHIPDKMVFYHRDHKYDDTARTTDSANGQTAIGFAVDDRFLSAEPSRVAVKITFHDEGPSKWAFIYNRGRSRRDMTCWGNGTIRTQTWILDDAIFDAEGMDYDFEIRAIEGDAIIKFVRVIKLAP